MPLGRGRPQREAAVESRGGARCKPHSVPSPAPLGGETSPPTHRLPLSLLSSLCPHPVQDLFSCTEQIVGAHRRTRAGTFVFSQISKTGKEIKDYVEAEAGNDPLLKGIPEDKNPFKEKAGCTLS